MTTLLQSTKLRDGAVSVEIAANSMRPLGARGIIVAVTLARPLHVSKDSQSKEKGKTKQATLISDFHARGSKSSLWPIRLARN